MVVNIKYYVVSFEILQTLKQNIGESRKQTKMAKTDFTREQVSIKMFTKLILQFKLDQISFTVLIRLSDGNRTPTDFSVLHLCSHHKIFAERMFRIHYDKKTCNFKDSESKMNSLFQLGKQL
jgi:hypothetical protein